MKIKPLNNMIVVEPIIENILYPNTDKGKVVAVGDDCKNIKVGDKVVFFAHGYSRVTIEKKYYYLVSEPNILAVLGE